MKNDVGRYTSRACDPHAHLSQPLEELSIHALPGLCLDARAADETDGFGGFARVKWES